LGEYNALLAAGVFDFMTGLRLVQKRGQLMSEVRDGGMAAVVGISAESVTQIIQEGRLVGVDVANFNSRVQTVISGRSDELLRARPLFEQAGANFVPLNVSAAFHSRFMQSAAETFGLFLNEFSFNAPEIPVVSNVTARPYGKNAPSIEVRELLTKQIFSPVQWTHSVLYMLGRGGSDFQEIGPGQVLTRLIQKIRQP
jgi:malonyl CoA-acyl carrier protein transacylase